MVNMKIISEYVSRGSLATFGYIHGDKTKLFFKASSGCFEIKVEENK